MHTIDLILYLAAFICFVVATATHFSKINFIALGLAFWILIPLIDIIKSTA